MRPADYLSSAPFRIAAGYALLFAASVAVLSSVAYLAATREMTRQLEAGIEQDVRPLVDAWQDGRTARLVRAVAERTASAEDGEVFYLLQDSAGRRVAGNLAPARPFEGWRQVELSRVDRHSGGEAVEVLAHGTALNGAFLLVGRNAHRIGQTQQILLRALGWTLAVTVLLGLLGGAAMARVSLRRLERIDRTAREIVEGQLDRRLPLSGHGDELDRIAATFNAMLDRIQELMEGLRQVSSDIAHDLRTPLGRLRQRLEQARRREATPEGLQAALDDAVEELTQILETFNALLRIAQIEAGSRRAQFGRVSLSEIAATVLEAYESVAEDRRQRLTGELAEGVEVTGDRDLLTQLLANLVENAIRHTPDGARIRIRLAAPDGQAVLEVADDGPGIPAEEHERVFRRFHRLEASRTTPGSGLGLALVKAVADLHGATVTLADNRPGLTVRVTFPAA